MKEMRSIVNAVFAFTVFLLVFALCSPGHARAGGSPRFLRMEVLDGSHGHGERVAVSVPFFMVRGALRFASLGRFERELDAHINHAVDHAELERLWAELKDAPEGQEIERHIDEDVLTFKKEGASILFQIKEHDGDEVRVRLPRRLVEAAVSEDRDLDVQALVQELVAGQRGDLVDVTARDGHVRIWLE